ncbi:MAG: membrane protein insertase YidC [Alphaproteobacteria bacterium]|nr:MAG: membrane protein insertase YidC [Alphaproteobacteria bacterium]
MEQRNLIIAAVLSVLIIFSYPFLLELMGVDMEPPAPPPAETTAPAETAPAPAPAAPAVDRETVIAQGGRVTIKSPRLKGSIALQGARIDDLVLLDYRTTVDDSSPNIVLLSPAGAEQAYYATFGWLAAAGAAVPGPETVWQTDSDTLTPDRPVTLTWDNGQGLRFTQTYDLDENYMFTVTQRVENLGEAPAELFPYGAVSRTGTPVTEGLFILHEGMIGVLEGTLKETTYDELQEAGSETYDSTGGWLGITDKYWLVALVPDQQAQVAARFAHATRGGTDLYQTDYRGSAVSLAPGASAETTGRLFAGAKEVRLLDHYGDQLGIPLLDRSVDFAGYLGYFLTLIAKPLFYVLDFIYRLVGNFGVAILLLTVLVKLAFYPLANKSYRAMSKMKLLTPEMTKLRERFKEDKARLNQEMMALYKREKVNPAAGCLPILVQIPVFIALYQVLYVTIEMRHAPFFGWIQDLSAPDPTSIFNFFGLAPWDVPDLGPLQILSIGVWPIIMGLTMWVQQKLNPAPPDPVQARIFMMLPIVFTFMLGHFAAGLVIYWAWNNILSIAQQRLIMWRMGVKT